MQRNINDDGRERRLANLRPFKKGQSGNPKGRPKSAMLSDALRRKMSEAMPDAPEKMIAEGVADALLKEALGGDVSAIKEVFDRTEGKVATKIDSTLEVFDWRTVVSDYGITAEMLLLEARQLLNEGNDEFDERISE